MCALSTRMPGNYKIKQFYDAQKCVSLARIYTDSLEPKRLRTNSNILRGERWSHNCIITAVITAACDACFCEKTENSVCLDIFRHSEICIIE